MPLGAQTFPTRICRTRSARKYSQEQSDENKENDREELSDILETLTTGIPPRCVFKTRSRCQNLCPHPRLRFMGETIHDIGSVTTMHSQQHRSWSGAQDRIPCSTQKTHCRPDYVSKGSHKLHSQGTRQRKYQAQILPSFSSIPTHDKTRNVLPSDGIKTSQGNAIFPYSEGDKPSMHSRTSGLSSQTPCERTEDPMVSTTVSTEQQVSSQEERIPSNIVQAQFSATYVKLSPTFGQSGQGFGTHSKLAHMPTHQQRTTLRMSTIPKAFHLPTGSVDLTGKKGVQV